MKKNLLFSFIVLFTVFAGILRNTSYQSHSVHYKMRRFNNNVQKRSGNIFENLVANKLIDRRHRSLHSLMNCAYEKDCGFIASGAGRGGINSGMIDFEFTKFSGRNLANYHTISVSQKTEG